MFNNNITGMGIRLHLHRHQHFSLILTIVTSPALVNARHEECPCFHFFDYSISDSFTFFSFPYLNIYILTTISNTSPPKTDGNIRMYYFSQHSLRDHSWHKLRLYFCIGQCTTKPSTCQLSGRASSISVFCVNQRMRDRWHICAGW